MYRYAWDTFGLHSEEHEAVIIHDMIQVIGYMQLVSCSKKKVCYSQSYTYMSLLGQCSC